MHDPYEHHNNTASHSHTSHSHTSHSHTSHSGDCRGCGDGRGSGDGLYRPGWFRSAFVAAAAIAVVVAMHAAAGSARTHTHSAAGEPVGHESPFTSGGATLRIEDGHPQHHEPSPAQQRSLDDAWVAACIAWADFRVLGTDQAATCVALTTRPAINTAGTAPQHVSTLRDTLMYVDWHHSIAGDLTVAVSGHLHVTNGAAPGEDPIPRFEVHGVETVRDDVTAAHNSGADLLIVAADDHAAAHDTLTELGSAVEVAAVRDVMSAVRAVCEHSHTEICQERVTRTR